MNVEICANSFESAQAAQDGGADRIELCENLSIGGITPNRDLIVKVLSELNIPVHVLIRPRGGNFVYSAKDVKDMLVEIDFCSKVGCRGIVSGALTSEGNIDFKITEILIKASAEMQFTFHRAFDICREPHLAFKSLINLGVDRLLSSGQQPKAIDGIELLKELKFLSDDKIEIMPGGGISSRNALYFKEAGFTSIHFSAIAKQATANKNLFESIAIGHSNQKEIEMVVKLLA